MCYKVIIGVVFVLFTPVLSDFCKIYKNQRYFKTIGDYQACDNKTCPVCPLDFANCREPMHVKCHSCCYAVSTGELAFNVIVIVFTHCYNNAYKYYLQFYSVIQSSVSNRILSP